ncbi:MAG: molecular chaperone DnaJ [Patescibacteria group bacterium]
MARDYYQVLGLGREASTEDIKKAFHRLAHKYHPDKKGGDEAKFKEVNEAYQILSDQRKRQAYDTYGEAGATGAGMGGGANGAWNFDFGGENNGQGFQFDLGDLFGEFFGGNRRQPGRRRGRDISVDIQIPFVEAIFGNERTILITKIGVCTQCSGSGAAVGSSKVKCTNCNGQGKIHENRRSLLGSFATVRDCENCNGTGEVPDKRCPECHGQGVARRNEEIKVSIPTGINDGEMIRLSGRGEAAPRGTPGDLYIKVHVEKHPIFRREGDNLVTDLAVKLTEAILGTEYDLKTLDGQLKIKIPAGISSGEILRVKGRGVPIGTNRRGDLYVHIKVKTPDKLSKKARKLVEELGGEGL